MALLKAVKLCMLMMLTWNSRPCSYRSVNKHVLMIHENVIINIECLRWIFTKHKNHNLCSDVKLKTRLSTRKQHCINLVRIRMLRFYLLSPVVTGVPIQTHRFQRYVWNDTHRQLEAADTPWAAAFRCLTEKEQLVHLFATQRELSSQL